MKEVFEKNKIFIAIIIAAFIIGGFFYLSKSASTTLPITGEVTPLPNTEKSKNEIEGPPPTPSLQIEQKSPELQIEKCKTKAEEYAKLQSEVISKNLFEKLTSSCSINPSPQYLEYQKALQEYAKSCGGNNPNQTFLERLNMTSLCIQMLTELQKSSPPSPEDNFLKCQKDASDSANIAAQRDYPQIYNEFYFNCLNQ